MTSAAPALPLVNATPSPGSSSAAAPAGGAPIAPAPTEAAAASPSPAPAADCEDTTAAKSCAPEIASAPTTNEAASPSATPAEAPAAETTGATASSTPAAIVPEAAVPDCGAGTGAALRQQGDAERSGSVQANDLDEDCKPSARSGAASDATTGSATSVGLLSNTAVANAQTGAIKAVGGTGGGTLENTSTSTVGATGGAIADTGDVTAGAADGNAPASALGGTTNNAIANISNITVTVGGSNEAPITARSEHEVDVRDVGLATATTASAPETSAVTPETAPVTGGNSGTAVTTDAAVTADAAHAEMTPASCAAHQASTTIHGQADKTVSGPAASGAPIAIAIGQQATVTNDGTTSGVSGIRAAGGAPSAATSPTTPNGAVAAADSAPSVTGGGSGGAAAAGLAANNTVENKALVDVTIGGNNYAPINVAIRTVTTIVNVAKALVETAAGGEPATDATGAGAHVANDVHLDSTAVVDIAGDNHSPIKIVLDIGAELWNRGMAFVGLAGDAGSTTADGLQVNNLLSLLGRASVRIEGSNYAPIDIEILLHNLIYNEGVAEALSVAQNAPGTGSAAVASALDTARRLSSGPASCLSLLANTSVVNGQVANVRMPIQGLRPEQVLAGNTHVVDVQGYGAAQCTTGDVEGGTSGDVVVGPADTILTVVSTQTADTSNKTDPSEDAEEPGTNPGDGTTTTPGAGGSTTHPGGGRPVQVVVAVTKAAVVKPGKVAAKNRKIIREEEVWEWQVQWVPLYVIYPDDPPAPKPLAEIETETTTSMAGAYSYSTTVEPVAPIIHSATGLDLLSQLQLALLGILAFLLLTILKRRMALVAARKAIQTRPELVVLPGGGAGAAA
jgi:hypothetical protein